MREKKDLQTTILIVCEGVNTEPEYLKELRNYLLGIIEKLHITIHPKPKSDEVVSANLREGGKPRTLRVVEDVMELLIMFGQFLIKTNTLLMKLPSIWQRILSMVNK